MKNKLVLLTIGAVLIGIGLFKPNFKLSSNNSNNTTTINVTKPSNADLLDNCDSIISSFKAGPSSRIEDAKRLASLYSDLATLIELDGVDLVIKNTEEIRQANSLSGPMLRMNIKSIYPNLAENMEGLVKESIGDDNIALNPELRAKAVEAFMAIAWACNEGSK